MARTKKTPVDLDTSWRDRQRAEGFVIIPEAAKAIGFNRQSIRIWIKAGHLKQTRQIGVRTTLVNLAEVRAFAGV